MLISLDGFCIMTMFDGGVGKCFKSIGTTISRVLHI